MKPAQPNNEVGVFDAKTNLSQLIERVARGETIIITRHGARVARLVPYEELVDQDRVREAVQGLRGFKGPKLPKGTNLRGLTREGRR